MVPGSMFIGWILMWANQQLRALYGDNSIFVLRPLLCALQRKDADLREEEMNNQSFVTKWQLILSGHNLASSRFNEQTSYLMGWFIRFLISYLISLNFCFHSLTYFSSSPSLPRFFFISYLLQSSFFSQFS